MFSVRRHVLYCHFCGSFTRKGCRSLWIDLPYHTVLLIHCQSPFSSQSSTESPLLQNIMLRGFMIHLTYEMLYARPFSCVWSESQLRLGRTFMKWVPIPDTQHTYSETAMLLTQSPIFSSSHYVTLWICSFLRPSHSWPCYRPFSMFYSSLFSSIWFHNLRRNCSCVSLTKHHAMKTRGDRRYSPTSDNLSIWWSVMSFTPRPTALPQRE